MASKKILLTLGIVVLYLGACVQSAAPIPPADSNAEGDSRGANQSTANNNNTTQNRASPSPTPNSYYPISTPVATPYPIVIQPPSDTECINADAAICLIERDIASRTNQYRASAQRQPLRFDAKLAAVSRDWSKKQYAIRSIGHAGFPSVRSMVYKQMFGNPPFDFTGENVAMTSGSSLAGLAQEFATMWYKSIGHRVNMLASGSNIIGVGISSASGNSGPYYATQIFGRE